MIQHFNDTNINFNVFTRINIENKITFTTWYLTKLLIVYQK